MQNERPDNAEPDAKLIKLVDRTGSWWPWTRQNAKKTLREQGEAIVPPLIALYQQARLRKRKWSKHDTFFVGWFVLYFFGAVLLETSHPSLTGLYFAYVFIMCGIAYVAEKKHPRNRLKKTANALAMFEDVRTVGPLAESLELRGNYTSKFASRALIHLLPRLQPTDAELLNAEQRACLCRILETIGGPTDIGLSLAILKAFQAVGGAEVLPTVKSLARKLAWTNAGKKLREAAQECLPAVEARAQEQTAHQTLLRASSPSQTSADVLLRPADTSASETEPRELLRASHRDNSERVVSPLDQESPQSQIILGRRTNGD